MTKSGFKCPRCGITSFNPNDAREKYCGRCHWWTGDEILGKVDPDEFGQIEAEKDAIDKLDLESMIYLWRHLPAGHRLFQGELGHHFTARLKELRDADEAGFSSASKRVGWDGQGAWVDES